MSSSPIRKHLLSLTFTQAVEGIYFRVVIIFKFLFSIIYNIHVALWRIVIVLYYRPVLVYHTKSTTNHFNDFNILLILLMVLLDHCIRLINIWIIFVFITWIRLPLIIVFNLYWLKFWAVLLLFLFMFSFLKLSFLQDCLDINSNERCSLVQVSWFVMNTTLVWWVHFQILKTALI